MSSAHVRNYLSVNEQINIIIIKPGIHKDRISSALRAHIPQD